MAFNETQLASILEINPKTTLKKGTVAKKIAMEHLHEYIKRIQGYELTEFKGGSKFKNGDTLVARITPCLENGKTAYVDILEDEEIAFGSTEFFVVRVKEGKADPQFVYYLMRSPEIRNITIQSMTGTSGRQRAQKESILDYVMNVPDIDIQKKIGYILSIFDTKIESNKRIIDTLETISKTIFKHWFIDFEFPNEQGESYKSSGGEMVESELGEIPKGWRTGTIDEIGSVVGGGTPSKKHEEYYTSNGISWITPKDLSNDKNIFIYKGAVDITELGLKKGSAQLLPKNTVLFSSRAPIGYIAIAGQDVTTNQGFKSVVPDRGFNNYFIYYLLKAKLPTIEAAAGGSTFKEISGKGLKEISIIIPLLEIVEKFRNVVEPLFLQINSLERENKKLEQLRDTLLPKLLSGEIEIPDELVVD
ncbi:restriction endonuclease subunit S [Bacillus pseudomycoides]|uniref:restriction endonuclease subunit S n=1 Tax=Bacillus pseudomycoides TaxID=64104 RepID=UPI000BF21AB9|nr:restriction endonuclease subunit S [Bacillus pseudomycoides]PEO42213.1 restriction endonuclease subunit S [Bacillus pseudomycoides]PHC34791.1 restriction endonuclease subunit S [Bacillus pseudomycoides]